MSGGFAVTDELGKFKQTNKGIIMNMFLKLLYDFLHNKVLADEQAFRNRRLAVRRRLNGGYSKAGH